MAFQLGELAPYQVAALRAIPGGGDKLAEPPSSWAVSFVRALVRELSGEDSLLPEHPTWAQMVGTVRSKVINQPWHIHTPNRQVPALVRLHGCIAQPRHAPTCVCSGWSRGCW